LQALKVQDFEKMKSIGKDIKTLLGIGNNILQLKREMQFKLARE
jgi:hypothetical protein